MRVILNNIICIILYLIFRPGLLPLLACDSAVPTIRHPGPDAVELPIERTVLLGSLNNKLQYYKGGWAAAEAGLNCDRNILKLLLLMMTVIIIRRDRTQLWKLDALVTLDDEHGDEHQSDQDKGESISWSAPILMTTNIRGFKITVCYFVILSTYKLSIKIFNKVPNILIMH